MLDATLEFAPRFLFLSFLPSGAFDFTSRIPYWPALPVRFLPRFFLWARTQQTWLCMPFWLFCFLIASQLPLPRALNVGSFVPLFWGTFKGCLFNNLLLRIVTCTHIQMYMPKHHVPLPCLIWTSLLSLTQCLSVVAGYHGHVIGISLRKWKLVITSVSYALWCNGSRTHLFKEWDRFTCLATGNICLHFLPNGWGEATHNLQDQYNSVLLTRLSNGYQVVLIACV